MYLYYKLFLLNPTKPKQRIDPDKLFNILKRSGFSYWDSHEQFDYPRFGLINRVEIKIRIGKVKSLLEGKNIIRDYVEMEVALESWDDRQTVLDKAIQTAFRLKKRLGLEIYDPHIKIFLDEKNMIRFEKNLESSYKKSVKREKASDERLKQYRESERNLITLPPPRLSFYFANRFHISITGEILAERNNIVLIEDTKVLLSDKPFALFLRLILELRKGVEGFVYRIDLVQEGYLSPSGPDQGISRLKQQIRYPMEAVFKKFNVDQFIEKKPKQIRLSNPPDMIKINVLRLLQHPNPAIVKLAKQFED